MATLYRKYRPQKFAQVVGQNHIKLTLEHELTSGQLAHAYLFCGPRAVGKTTLARVLAKSLNCLERKEGTAEPCDHCVACQDIVAGRAMDIIEIDAASHTGVDNVRENVIANARITPVSLKYKIFIIDEVHMLSTAAFNALLKIMEEPPEFVVFVLCTTEVHKIPTTIISRCQRFDFKKISVTDIVKKLEFMAREEKVEVEAGVLEAVARYSGGHMRDAESALGQILSLSEDDSGHLSVSSADATLVIPRNDISEVMSLLELVAKKDAGGAIDLINRVLYDGFDLKVFVADTLEILRQALLIKISPQLIASLGVDLGESLESRLIEVISGLGVKDLIRILERMMRVQQELKDSAIIQLPLEMAVAELCLETLAPAPVSQPTLVTDNQTAPAPQSLKTTATAGAILSLADIQGKWNEFLTKVKRINHSMSFVLKVCQPVSLEGQTVCLAFRHKIHKDRINEAEIKRMVEEVLKEVYNENLLIATIIDENINLDSGDLIDKNGLLSNNEAEAMAKNEASDEAINNILKNLGGKIVG